MKKEKLVTVTMRVDAELRNRLIELAKAEDRLLSNYIRVLLTERVNQSQSQGKAA